MPEYQLFDETSPQKQKYSQDYARINHRFYVQRHFLPIFVPRPLKFGSPQHPRCAYEKRVISQFLAYVDPSPKAMSRPVRFYGPR
jgi:hypothetical protein